MPKTKPIDIGTEERWRPSRFYKEKYGVSSAWLSRLAQSETPVKIMRIGRDLRIDEKSFRQHVGLKD